MNKRPLLIALIDQLNSPIKLPTNVAKTANAVVARSDHWPAPLFLIISCESSVFVAASGGVEEMNGARITPDKLGQQIFHFVCTFIPNRLLRPAQGSMFNPPPEERAQRARRGETVALTHNVIAISRSAAPAAAAAAATEKETEKAVLDFR